MMQPESEEACREVRLHYDSPASSYKKGGGAQGKNLVPSPSYLSPKSKAFLRPSENGGDITPPTSKASSSPDDDYSPVSNDSRKSSSSGIDHTALLLGLHDEFEDESDDEAKHCCFSPMASMDALDGVVDSDDDDDDGSDGPPLQLAIDTANRGAVTVSNSNIGGGADLSLVARQLEVQGRITEAGGKSNDTLLKAASLKAKASSELSAKAQKAKKKTLDVITPKIALPPVISSRKSEQRINDELSAASSKGKIAAKHASEMVFSMKDKAAQKAHEVKDKAAQKAHKFKDITLEVVGRKTYHKADEQSHNGSEAISLLSDDVGSEGSGGSGGSAKATKRAIKLPNLPRPPKTLSLKKGSINKKFMSSIAASKRTQSKDTIDQNVEQHYQSTAYSSAPSSIISPTNSYDMSLSSCIDADGFLLSPQSSLGFISPTASIDEHGGGIDGNMAFDAFSDTDGFDNFETSSISRVRSNTDEDGELLSKELKAAIQSKAARKPPLLPPSGRPPRQK
jgi:hypothetical protein